MKNCLVLGSGRSGTSLTAGLLARIGYHCGANLMATRESNPKGFFEDHLVNYVNELIMREAVRVSRLAPSLRRLLGRPPHLPGQLWLVAMAAARDWQPIPPAPWIMTELAARSPFAYKDPRFCYTLNAWRPYLGDCRFVCVFRDPAATVASMVRDLQSEPYYANLSIRETDALAIWTAMYTQVLETHCTDPEHWLFIDYEQLLAGEGVGPLNSFLGVSIDAELIDPSLNRAGAERVPVGDAARQLYQRLTAMAQDTQRRALGQAG